MMGNWKSIEDLEEHLSLPELEALLSASREKEERYFNFMAAINGIDLSKEQSDHQARFDEIQRRAQAKLTGADENALELDVFGLDIEYEE